MIPSGSRLDLWIWFGRRDPENRLPLNVLFFSVLFLSHHLPVSNLLTIIVHDNILIILDLSELL